MLTRVRALPSIEAASAAFDLPLDGGRFGLGAIKVAGAWPPPGLDSFAADWNVVEPGFFETLKLRLTRGRDFSPSDTANAPRVAIINEATR